MNKIKAVTLKQVFELSKSVSVKNCKSKIIEKRNYEFVEKDCIRKSVGALKY